MGSGISDLSPMNFKCAQALEILLHYQMQNTLQLLKSIPYYVFSVTEEAYSESLCAFEIRWSVNNGVSMF